MQLSLSTSRTRVFFYYLFFQELLFFYTCTKHGMANKESILTGTIVFVFLSASNPSLVKFVVGFCDVGPLVVYSTIGGEA